MYFKKDNVNTRVTTIEKIETMIFKSFFCGALINFCVFSVSYLLIDKSDIIVGIEHVKENSLLIGSVSSFLIVRFAYNFANLINDGQSASNAIRFMDKFISDHIKKCDYITGEVTEITEINGDSSEGN